VEAEELLSNQKGVAAFAYAPAAQCGAPGRRRGARPSGSAPTRPGPSAFAARTMRHDREGTSDFNAPRPSGWRRRCAPGACAGKIVGAADVNKPRELRRAGQDLGRPRFRKVDPEHDEEPATKVGYLLDGPAILLGMRRNNPLIAAAERLGFLPYKTGGDFPGRGAACWPGSGNAIGIGQESIALIAFDAAGMAEAWARCTRRRPGWIR